MAEARALLVAEGAPQAGAEGGKAQAAAADFGTKGGPEPANVLTEISATTGWDSSHPCRPSGFQLPESFFLP